MSTYSTEGLDQDLVKQSRRGKNFGAEDKARYDALARAREVKKNPAKPDAPKEDKDDLVYAGGTPGFYDKGGPGYGGEPFEYTNQQIGKGGGEVRLAVEPNPRQSGNPIDGSVAGDNDNVPSNLQTIAENTQRQSVNQNNNINTKVNGNKNTVITEQDNSVRNYGGSSRSFTYNGGKGGATGGDAPVSMATMGGFYDVDDSPAAQAKRNSLHTTMNADNQKRYAGDAMKTYAKYGNIDARSYTDESMENAINRSTQYSFDRADRQTGHVFGDIWNDNYITEEWKMPSAPSPIESNAAEIADKAKKDIEDI